MTVKEGKCGENEGDCDNDSQCKDGLVCGSNNCPTGSGSNFNSNTDCCTKIESGIFPCLMGFILRFLAKIFNFQLSATTLKFSSFKNHLALTSACQFLDPIKSPKLVLKRLNIPIFRSCVLKSLTQSSQAFWYQICS